MVIMSFLASTLFDSLLELAVGVDRTVSYLEKVWERANTSMAGLIVFVLTEMVFFLELEQKRICITLTQQFDSTTEKLEQ